MTRIRILFAVFTLALLAPILLLVQRSLHSLDVENRLQQQTVAERVFDEMERGLSRILEAEEARPIDQYETTPSELPDPFVVRRFQIDARSDAFADAGDERPAPSRNEPGARRRAKEEADTDDAIGRDALAEALDAPAAAAPKGMQRQAPGTTMRLDRHAGASVGQPAPEPAAQGRVSEYEALRSLNKAASERLSDRGAPSPRYSAPIDDSAPPEALDLQAGSFGPGRMSGRGIGADRLMLHRAVARDGSVYHQGVVIDVPALGRWLRERSIGSSPLQRHAAVEIRVGTPDTPPPDDRSGIWFRHRFAPPFADLTAQMRLPSLSFGSSDLYLKALSASLVVAVLVGLALLYRSVAIAMRFAERRSNFAAAVSHELKTPLTAIRMYGEMLRDGVVPSEAKRKEYYRHITGESERLTRLIDNVLELAKLEKGNREMRPVVAPIAAPIAAVVEMMRAHAADQGFELVFDVEPNLPAVRHEPDALAQMLWNLIDNAVKYARAAGDRRIHVRALRAGPGQVAIEVRDHGPGVDPRHLRHIFAPFHRGQNELTRTAPGAGLGLALVKSLAERMGASVRGYNHPDGGFAVELLLARAEPSES